MNEKRPITRRLAPGTIGLRALLGCLPVVGVVGPERASAEEKVQNRLTRLAVRESETATEIVISGSVAPTFAVFKLSDPIRLFVDISNADTQALESPIDLDNGVVGEVSALQFQDSQARVGRIIIGLQLDALYTVRAQGNDLVVTIDATQRRRKVVPIAAGSDSGATHAQMAAIEARVAEAEQRARGAESRARTLDEQGQSAIADARLAAKAAEEEHGRAEAAVALAGRDAAAKVALANTTAAATVALAKAQADAQRVASEESSRRSQAEVEAASVARTKAEESSRRSQAEVEAASVARTKAEESSRRSQVEVEAASVARTKAEESSRRDRAEVEAASVARTKAEESSRRDRAESEAASVARTKAEESSRRAQAEAEAASVARTKAEDANRRAQADVETARAEAARDRAIAKRAATEKAEALA
ncbi:MAG: AMIN domain-containing protein, partial [Myxococcales bacterium]|nr:AMIN domain-containing protein [Myxococcales bacterium]